MLRAFMRYFKQKPLLLLGIALAVLAVSVMTYSVWKILFYFDAAHYGERLTLNLSTAIESGDFSVAAFRQTTLKKYRFASLDFFPQEFASATVLPNSCQAMTDVHGVTDFSASVRCLLGERTVYYHFRKNYDHAWALIFLIGLALLSLWYLVRWILATERLKQEHFEKSLQLACEKTVFDVGAKLVHDLKKGVLSQLNALREQYGSDFDLEMTQPDFKIRLKEGFDNHFQVLEFLNKYMSLLTANLKHQPESHWVKLNHDRFIDYFKATFTPISLDQSGDENTTSGICVVFSATNRHAEIFLGEDDFSLWVPEMSFYRILKNISENYNAYGKGRLILNFKQIPNSSVFVLTAENFISATSEKNSSTGLGLIIIKQLLKDNFGEEDAVEIFNDGMIYRLTIRFPPLTNREITDSVHAA